MELWNVEVWVAWENEAFDAMYVSTSVEAATPAGAVVKVEKVVGRMYEGGEASICDAAVTQVY